MLIDIDCKFSNTEGFLTSPFRSCLSADVPGTSRVPSLAFARSHSLQEMHECVQFRCTSCLLIWLDTERKSNLIYCTKNSFESRDIRNNQKLNLTKWLAHARCLLPCVAGVYWGWVGPGNCQVLHSCCVLLGNRIGAEVVRILLCLAPGRVALLLDRNLKFCDCKQEPFLPRNLRLWRGCVLLLLCSSCWCAAVNCDLCIHKVLSYTGKQS